MKRFARFLLAVAFLGGCSAYKLRQPKEFYVSAGAMAHLLHPSAFNGELSAVQEIKSFYGGAERVMTGIVKIFPSSMQVIVLADAARIMTLNYTSAGIKCEFSPLVPVSKIEPEYVLFDIQLTYFPVDAINSALPEGMSFREEGAIRVLYRGDKIIASITRDGGTIEFVNHERSYSYKIIQLEN
jgi:hypothetical protein